MELKDIFITSINATFKKIKEKSTGEVCDDCSISNFVFTDNIFLFTEAATDLDMFDRLSVGNQLINKKNHGTIIFLLESPHVSEYKQKPYYPAKGTSGGDAGYLLKKRIPNIIKNLKIDYSFDLYFVNRIQFQVSLGQKGDELKNRIFLETWNNPAIRQDLVDRINKIINNYDKSIIIDCNTEELSKQIQSKKQDIFIEVDKSNITYYKTTHPCSWINDSIEPIKSEDTGLYVEITPPGLNKNLWKGTA